MTPHRFAALLGLCSPLLTACELESIFDDVQTDRALVDVMVTHHGTPENGAFPDRGGDGEMRVFPTDEGWEIQLLEAIVVTSMTTLHECDEESIDIDMYWGALPEDLSQRDLDTLTLGGTEVESARFCSLTVSYGPYVPGVDAAPRSNSEIDGATIYMAGGAKKGDVTVPFQIRVVEGIDVDLDLSTVDRGAPLTVTGDEPFPVELTVGKTYDRLFDGVDFATVTPWDLNAHVLAVLAQETRVSVGSVEP